MNADSTYILTNLVGRIIHQKKEKKLKDKKIKTRQLLLTWYSQRKNTHGIMERVKNCKGKHRCIHDCHRLHMESTYAMVIVAHMEPTFATENKRI